MLYLNGDPYSHYTFLRRACITPVAAVFIQFFFAATCLAQEESTFRPGHNIGLTIGHEQAFHGIEEDGKSRAVILPCWGVDYNFEFARKFSVGLHVDLVMETFDIKKNLDEGEETVIERKRPVAPAVIAFYKPTERWSFGLGAGAEFEQEENFFLNRAAVEYAVEIRKGWEVYGVVQYDIRWKAYDTFSVGLGIGKTFRKKER
jgi:hypothetical protein